jgi:type I restriction enzyme S subunit
MAALIRSGEGRKRIKHLAQGATRYNLSKRALLKLELKLPLYDEQKAVAAVLSDMDDEIKTLESRLTKAQAVKEGMMQNLLTGRVRLV